MNNLRNIILTSAFCLGLINLGLAQESKAESAALLQVKKDSVIIQPEAKDVKSVAKKWYESVSIRGYSQLRYNRLLETNDSLKK